MTDNEITGYSLCE